MILTLLYHIVGMNAHVPAVLARKTGDSIDFYPEQSARLKIIRVYNVDHDFTYSTKALWGFQLTKLRIQGK